MVFQRKKEREKPTLNTFWLIMPYNTEKVVYQETQSGKDLQ